MLQAYDTIGLCYSPLSVVRIRCLCGLAQETATSILLSSGIHRVYSYMSDPAQEAYAMILSLCAILYGT